MSMAWGSRDDATRDLREMLAGVSPEFDYDTFFDQVLTFREGHFEIEDPYNDDQALWALVAQYDQAADQIAETKNAARNAASEQLAEAIREASRTWIAAEWGHMRLRPNSEFRAGGLRDWPTAASWWVEITAPDGEVDTVRADTGSWVGLLEAVEEAEHDWIKRGEEARKEAERTVESVAAVWRAARDAERMARQARDDAFRYGADAGLTAYRMARIAGLTTQGVDKALRQSTDGIDISDGQEL